MSKPNFGSAWSALSMGEGVKCRGCGYALTPDARVCPVCGFERAPYPAGKVERYDWVLDQPIADPIAKLVLFALISHDKPGGNGIFPSQERLARMTGLSRRAVVNALARLRKAGWIVRRKTRGRSGRQTANRYRIQPGGLLQSARGALGQCARGAP